MNKLHHQGCFSPPTTRVAELFSPPFSPPLQRSNPQPNGGCFSPPPQRARQNPFNTLQTEDTEVGPYFLLVSELSTSMFFSPLPEDILLMWLVLMFGDLSNNPLQKARRVPGVNSIRLWLEPDTPHLSIHQHFKLSCQNTAVFNFPTEICTISNRIVSILRVEPFNVQLVPIICMSWWEDSTNSIQ